MIQMNEGAAINRAIELASILCANPQCGITLDKAGANNLADFIETLENRFINSDK